MVTENRRLVILGAIAALLLIGVVIRLALPSASAGADPSRASASPAELAETAVSSDAPVEERLAAVAHLVGAPGDGAKRVREVLARTDEPSVRAQCLLVLSDAGDYESMDPMIDGLTDAHPQVRQAAHVAVSRMFGGMKITVQTSPLGPTAADRQRQAQYYRNAWIAMQQAPDFDEFQDHQQGRP